MLIHYLESFDLDNKVLKPSLDQPDKLFFIMVMADWCGHCKNAAPEFNKLVAASPITLKDGSKATVKILDADKDKSELSQYKVKGFPTVLIIDGDVTTEYPGKRTANDITEFLNSNY